MRSLSNCAVGYTNRSSRKVNGWALFCAGITRITVCRPTSRRSTCSGQRLRIAGSSRFGDEASAAASTGRGWIVWPHSGFLVPASFTLGRSSALLSEPEIRAQCGSSARWDLCGGRLAQSRVNRPYRDPQCGWPASTTSSTGSSNCRRSVRARGEGPEMVCASSSRSWNAVSSCGHWRRRGRCI
jgi:hypothetical protein